MPFTHRPEESTEDRNQRLTNTADAFILWASEFGLIDVLIDEDGEVSFTPVACEHEEDEVFFAQYAPKHAAPRRTTQRLRRAALPVAASMLVGSAAYAAHVTHSKSASLPPVAVGPVSASAQRKPAPVKITTVPARSVPTTGDVILGGFERTQQPVLVWMDAPTEAPPKAAAHNSMASVAHAVHKAKYKGKHAAKKTLPEQASEVAQEAVSKTKHLPAKIVNKVKDAVTHPSVTLPPVVPPVADAVVPEVLPPVADPVVDTIVDPVVQTLP